MPRPSHKKSVVWAFFDPSSDNKTAVCKLCRKSFVNHKNTSNYKEHLRRVHPIQLQEEEDVRSGTIPTVTVSQHPASDATTAGPTTLTPIPGPSHRQVPPMVPAPADSAGPPAAKRTRQLRLYAGQPGGILTEEESGEFDRALVKMIVTDFQPLSIVEDEGFTSFVKKLNPRYQLPSRKTLSEKLLPQFYEEKKKEFVAQLQNVPFVSLTADYWKALNNKTFLSLTAHYIFKSSLISTTLATAEVTVSHTGANTACVIQGVCDNWDITHKVVTVVTDNAANMKKAINEELRKHNHPCVAHTLNLSVNDAIEADKDLMDILAKCRAIVTYFRQSSVAAYKLKEVQAELNVADLVLKQDIATRWNSTYLMVDRLLEVRQPLCLALLQLERAPTNLNATEWVALTDILPVLKPFLEMTTQLSGEKYITMSMIVPLIRGLRYTLRMACPTSDVGMRLRTNLNEFVTRRLGVLETNKIVAKATFLDPRFKRTGFGLEENADKAQQWVLEELTGLEAAEAEPVSTEPNNLRAQIQGGATDTRTDDNDLNIWSDFDLKTLEQRHHTTPRTTAMVMLRQYVEIPLLDRRRDPLMYWEGYSKTFPGLYKMAQKYLSVPATSVPSERLFSKAGYILTERRNRLSSEKLDYIIFLSNNL